MLHIITSQHDPLIDLLRDDPVRPEIPSAMRVHDSAEIFVWMEDGKPAAVTCVSYCNTIPDNVHALWTNDHAQVAAFYTIWSYAPGCGRKLIRAAQLDIKSRRANITRWVTLSPKTDLARKFHHTNGAVTLRENSDTVNYEYA
jgi:hypothetical protein